jgi:colanic acid/amylovoran biosynthesis glycosyltransferase
MRILFVVEHFPCLSETFVLNQITGLLDRGHDVEIYPLGLPGEGPIHPDVRRYDLMNRVWQEKPAIPRGRLTRVARAAQIIVRNLPRGGARLLRTLNVPRYGRDAANLKLCFGGVPFLGSRKGFDIVHCHFGPNGVSALSWREAGLWRGRLTVAFHAHEIAGFTDRAGKSYYRNLFRSDARLLPVSDFWRRKLITWGADPGRVTVHRMGVDCEATEFRPRPIPADRTVEIISVCRLVEQKGLEYALRAFGLLRRRGRDLHFTIVGDGPIRDELVALASEIGIADAVTFLGSRPQDRVRELLAASHVFLAPSVTASDGLMEGIPVSIMEAMAAGLPVVGTRHSGIPELIEDGVSGILAEERDVAGLADGLGRMLDEPPFVKSVQLAGRDVVEKRYNIRGLVIDLERIFQEELSAA